MDKILEVKDLKVSFRTSGGTLKAVRDISFDLERGKTLAIVGESGSGKSVTSKAILGILAGNSIIEGGEILYDGRDLLKISEDDMYKLRGDKISMIFQDPLSSLNPIVKIGKQITEAMLLKNKASRKEAKVEFNALLALLLQNISAATGNAERAKKLCEEFDKFAIEGNRLENRYNNAASVAEGMVDGIEDFTFRLSKKQKMDVKANLNGYAKALQSLEDPFYTAKFRGEIDSVVSEIQKAAESWDKSQNGLTPAIESAMNHAKQLVEKMQTQPRPRFFYVGFYGLRHPDEKLEQRDINELNEQAHTYMIENFMQEFLDLEIKGVEYSFQEALKKKKALLPVLEEAKTFFAGTYDKKSALAYAKTLSDQVEESIDRLEITKDSKAYTFRTTLTDAINKYFFYQKNNPKEEARFARQTAKREALIAKGKKVDWKVVPKVCLDLDMLKADIEDTVAAVESRYQAYIAAADQVDYKARSIEIIEFMKDKASKAVYKVTRAMARERAIKLMDEVGIAEPRMRYNQYPFEFSGGMRQRIVIAIALSADPEILICDEPTTALDVTIQSQILELINNLKETRNLSVIFITHDLGVVANMADDIAVMYAGKIVEYGTAEDIFYDPRHPYTWALLSSMPDLDTKEKLDAIPGTPPNMIYPPVGDAFAARNKYAMEIDFEEQPPMFEVSPTHKAATWLLHPDAPAVALPKVITDRIARMKKKAGGAQNG